MMLTNLATAARKSGLQVVEIPGWERRGRPASTGGFNPRGVLCHHTGASSDARSYVDWMATVGRSDLPAPLCQLALGRTGVVYVVAAGRSNHAGSAKAVQGVSAGDGNELWLGIEAMNTGSEGWTDRQWDAYVRLCAALCDFYGWPRSHVAAHAETSSTGKWDPGQSYGRVINMDRFRADVRAVDLQEDEVDKETIKDAMREVLNEESRTPAPGDGDAAKDLMGYVKQTNTRAASILNILRREFGK